MINKLFLIRNLAILIFVLITNSCNYKNENISGLNHLKKIVFVNPSGKFKNSKEEINDLKSFKNSLYTVGINYTEINVQQLNSVRLNDYDIIFLPFASANELNKEEITKVGEAVAKGLNIVFDGVTKMNNELNIVLLDKPITVTQIRDLQFPKNILYWTEPAKLLPIDTVNKKYKILCVDEITKFPIAISNAFGKGKYIYFSTLFDPVTEKGYSRFPFLIETLENNFGSVTLAERKTVEMFFDPGMREGLIKIDDLVSSWRKHGIKRIYAGGWYFDYGYDYETLVNTCHNNGIQVYCWLETPMISKKFWEKHPEWREKTAYLKDAYIDWRYLVNLADANCRNEVFRLMDDFLMKYDWDGVNLAELYFEPSPVGPELPENFTPMNNIVRNEFKHLSGFDPVLLFNKKDGHYWKKDTASWKMFASYRKTLCFRLKKYFLDFLTNVKNKKENFELMLTVIDVSMTPELSDNIAENTQNTLSLYTIYDITMQIEDPSNCWGLTPDRYRKLGQFYRDIIKDKNKLVFDCNVVNSHEKGFGGFPAEKPTGEEIRQIVYNMSLSDSRPAFYSEDAINENDFHNINSVLARGVKIIEKSPSKWKITTVSTVSVNTGKKDLFVKLDNKVWFAGDDDFVILPEGEHILNFSNTAFKNINTIEIRSISGELKQADFTDKKLEFSYSEEMNSCYIIINNLPAQIYIDNKKTDCEIYKNKPSEYSIKLPKGTHHVKMTL